MRRMICGRRSGVRGRWTGKGRDRLTTTGGSEHSRGTAATGFASWTAAMNDAERDAGPSSGVVLEFVRHTSLRGRSRAQVGYMVKRSISILADRARVLTLRNPTQTRVTAQAKSSNGSHSHRTKPVSQMNEPSSPRPACEDGSSRDEESASGWQEDEYSPSLR